MPQHRCYMCVYGEVCNCCTIQDHCYGILLILRSPKITFASHLSHHCDSYCIRLDLFVLIFAAPPFLYAVADFQETQHAGN